jgi:hypothetical protein
MPVPSPRRNGRRRIWSLLGLGTALAAATALVVIPTARPPGQANQAASMTTVERVWPDAKRADVPAGLPDGPAYSPVFFLDQQASLGTAPSPDGTQLRLVLRSADGAVRELRRLPLAATPQYGGFARSGDDFAWAESTADAEGKGRTEMWATNLRSGQPPRRLTADTGDVVFFNSQYDMVLGAGRLFWAAVAPGREPATEVRSVPLTGGTVSVRTERGAWAMSAWPWLASAGSGVSGPVQLRNLEAGELIDVDAAGTELVNCSPAWCRVLVLAGDGPSRIDLMRPDGTDRRRIAEGVATASLIDVAVLDRFEVLSLADSQRTVTNTQQLLLYDVRRKQTVVVADGVGLVLCRGGVLWWSTGDSETTAWHTLDLRTLS